jgi:hypothetical protein
LIAVFEATGCVLNAKMFNSKLKENGLELLILKRETEDGKFFVLELQRWNGNVKSKKQANFILQLEKLPSLHLMRTCQALVELNYLEGRESGM